MSHNAYLSGETYGGRSVVIDKGYKCYVVSKHRTQFNARRKLRKLDFKGKIRKVGNWWVVLRGLPKQYQLQRRIM